jgi:phage/plasmid primase-like uncharacterized protein
MSDASQVVQQMVAYGMPQLPPNHPVLDGKYHRFGPKKAAWYILREMSLKSGRIVVTGAFGFFQGENRNTVPVTVDMEEMSDDERAEFGRKQKEVERIEAEKREEEVRLAAGRAQDQWNKAAGLPLDHPYLERKRVVAEGVRVSAGGLLLIPMARGGRLMGLQKIDRAGGKAYNAGMDKIGTFHMLGAPAGAPIIAIGEGYATCCTARMGAAGSYDLPVAVAFDAGGLMAVAQALRAAYPAAHLLFLADDDYLLTERFVERLREEFKVSAPVPIDGATHQVRNDDGELVDVMAVWRNDKQGVGYIDADMRCGRLIRTYTYKNAGVASCKAAAKAVGNASVVMPVFTGRAGRKLTDFNDLQIEEGLETVAAQIGVAILAAQQPKNALPAPAAPEREQAAADPVAEDAPAPPGAQRPAAGDSSFPAAQQPMNDLPAAGLADGAEYVGEVDALYDQAVAVVLEHRRASISLVQRHLRIGYNRAARLLEQMELGGVVAPMQSNGNRELLVPPAPPGAERPAAGDSSSPAAQQPKDALPAPSDEDAEPDLPPSNVISIFHDAPPPPGAERPASGALESQERGDGEVPPHVLAAAGGPFGEGEGESAPAKKDKPKKVYGQEHWDAVDDVLANFVLIYGEDLVWDCRQRMLMKLSAMRVVVSNSDVMKFWGGPARKWVLKKNIVFDPRERPSPAASGPTATVNLFSGWKMTPKKGDCMRIRTLLSHLCDGNEDLELWIARWLAYPLRNPGAKMETSIIMHGDEGSGKNFFFEKVVKAIYGEYGYVIGNAQLESNFNDWASMKLFMVADEVVTRSELRQMKGKLKYLVSGDTVIVNPKGLPEHSEANQMNFVFLSNELQPLALDKTDRRYLVVWTPPALMLDFYIGVAQEIAAGGIEAFYHYLVHELDMGDFNEHTKPLYNKAKDQLIEKSLAPAERFYREWSKGLLPLPFISCGVQQLYEAFQVWCGRSGESKYTSLTLFSPSVERYAGAAMRKKTILYELGAKVKQRYVFLLGEQPEGKTLRDWAEACSSLFESHLNDYRHRARESIEA